MQVRRLFSLFFLSAYGLLRAERCHRRGLTVDRCVPETGPDEQCQRGVRRDRCEERGGGSAVRQEAHRLLHTDQDSARKGRSGGACFTGVALFVLLPPKQLLLDGFISLLNFLFLPL